MIGTMCFTNTMRHAHNSNINNSATGYNSVTEQRKSPLEGRNIARKDDVRLNTTHKHQYTYEYAYECLQIAP